MVAEGANAGDAPDITYVPPHEPVYQFQLAPVPRLPPVIPRVVFEPAQIGVVPDAEVAGDERVLIATVTLTQVVVFNVPCARTK